MWQKKYVCKISAFQTVLYTLMICVLANTVNVFPVEESDVKYLNFTSLGVKYGHSVEDHEVITEDGYILTLFHIPGKRKTPVLLMHGTGDHADTYIIRGNKSLAITLADADYDVWVGNLRGNKYARHHTKLNPDLDPEFWNFSFHEAGLYDLSATIDYVLSTTGQKKLQAIGHSQGSTIYFVLLSTKPEYNENIKLLIAMAPVVYLNNLTPPVSTLAEIGPEINRAAKEIGVEEIPSEKLPVPKFSDLKCGLVANSFMCTLLSIYYLLVFDSKTIEPEFFQVLLGHYPGNTSRKTLAHYNQVALGRNFSQFDYGRKGNIERYGDAIAPVYNLQQVKVRTAMLVGGSDRLATVKDTELLRTVLPNVVFYHIMEPKMWNHVDFIWRNDMDVYMFPIILKLLKEYDD